MSYPTRSSHPTYAPTVSRQNFPVNRPSLSHPQSQRGAKSLSPKRRSQVRPDPSQRGLAWLAGGSVAMFGVLAVLPTQSQPGHPVLPWKGSANVPALTSHFAKQPSCQKVEQAAAQLSRQQLADFLTVPVNASKANVQKVLSSPYCFLSTPDQVETEIAAYPLVFDPDTWVVVNYKNGQYTGYEFAFHIAKK